MELWDGKTDAKKKNGKNAVRVSQPISGQVTGQPMNNPAMTQSLYTDGTAISSLPTNESSNQMQPQQLPNYDAMYKQDTTPLVGAATPGMSQESFGPVAANDLVGGAFGSAW
jgi:hypothetical protein